MPCNSKNNDDPECTFIGIQIPSLKGECFFAQWTRTATDLPPIFVPVLMLAQKAESKKVGGLSLLEHVAFNRVNYKA